MFTPRSSRACILAALLTSSVQADVIDDWNSMLCQTLAGIGSSATPTGNSRSLAIMSVSMYEAVNSVGQAYSPYLSSYQSYSGSVSLEAAAAQAGRDAVVSLYGGFNVSYNGAPAVNVTTYADQMLSTQLSALGLSGAVQANSTALGSASASAVLSNRSTDGFGAAYTYSPQPVGTPGAWQPNAPGGQFVQAQAGYMTPWVMSSGSQFRAAPPPSLGSVDYANAYNEVKTLGAAVGSTRTADQSNIALHWADSAGTESPPGHWNYIAQSVSGGLDFDDKARLFALLNISLADAAIATWETKREYDFWRPITAIQQGDIDGNALTEQDTAWASYIGTPSFPAYTSGHSAFSQSAADILELYFGTDNMAFTSTSHSPLLNSSNNTRSFTSFEAAADEAGMSRIYGGIHYSFDNVAGQQIGADVASLVYNSVLQPVPEPSGALLAMLAGLGLLRRRRKGI
jgi:MYXO-CTERM domain-containing protein